MCLEHAACLGILNTSRGRKFGWIHFLPRGFGGRTRRRLVRAPRRSAPRFSHFG